MLESLTRPGAILLHPDDDVLIARTRLARGTVVSGVSLLDDIPAGHKVARREIALGAPVRRYSQVIGVATTPIAAGAHVHLHNLGMGEQGRDMTPSAFIPLAVPERSATFSGIRRSDGRVATRNYLGVLSTVNCSATVARAIADHFTRQRPDSPLDAFPRVDGVVALTHGSGCAMDDAGPGMQVLRRTMAGYARHPNLAGVLVVGLGCEANQIGALLESGGLTEGPRLRSFTIQKAGGTRRAVARGIELAEAMLRDADAVVRVPCDVAHLAVGLQCGGSDGFSGISANPALGHAVDLLVAHGGTAILSETPEIYGAEHLLALRAASPAIADRLLARIRWWEAHLALHGATLNNNPSPGNKAGGLTTILEKSLGAIAKGGTSPVRAVYEYAEPVTARGLVFMDTPGYDPVSATGQVAGGANLICFTTGRGSAYGCAPAPSVKLATNTPLWQRQEEDMDLNCGGVLDGSATVAEVGERIFALMLATASGQRTKSETHGYGQHEFVPWTLGATL